jgi:hypothetical protein
MRLATTWNMNAGGKQDISFKVRQPDVAMGSDIHVLFDTRRCLRKDCAKFDRCGTVTPGQHARKKGPTHVLSQQSRNYCEGLRGSLERSVLAEKMRAQPKRQELRKNDETRDHIAQCFDGFPLVHCAGLAFPSGRNL